MNGSDSAAPGFLAVSVVEGAAAPDIDAASRAIRTLGEAVIAPHPGTTGTIVRLSKGLRSPSGPFVPTTEGTSTEIVPPGAAAWATAQGWAGASDTAGLHHLYYRSAEHWSAISTSAVALGLLSGPAADRNALGVVSLAGHALGRHTVVAGVSKVQAGETCRLHQGRLHVTGPESPPIERKTWSTDDRSLRKTGAKVVSRIVRDALEDAADPVLELSGGLDSRLLLAAIPRESRRGMVAFTLGAPDSDDVVVAKEIARRTGLDHRCIDMRSLAELPPDEAEALVVRVGRLVDWSGNPISLAVLAWAESHVADDRPRLSGQNGEFGRGFYYALLPRWLPNTDTTVAALGRWRVFANDRVDTDLLRPEARTAAERAALSELRAAVRPGPFLAATDELYLEMRMARWLGPAYTLAARSRNVLAPFLDQRYLSWVRSTSPVRRRGSRALAAVLHELDPDLASLPLAGGPSPRTLARGGLHATGATAPTLGRKVAAKVGQRIRPRARPPAGAAALASLVQRSWAMRADALEAAISSPLVHPEVVRAIADGSRAASPATVGYLLALDQLERSGLGG